MELYRGKFSSVLFLAVVIVFVYIFVGAAYELTGSTVAATLGMVGAAFYGWNFGRIRGIIGGACISLGSGISMVNAGLVLAPEQEIVRIAGMLFIIVTGLVFGTIRMLFDQLRAEILRRQTMEHELINLNELLEEEKERSEKLLLNVLPLSISNRLKENPSHIADTYPEVTIIFADIVDFTKVSNGIAPNDLVQDLNTIFTRFDEICIKYGLEKIKTIGDSYMAVAGLPDPQGDHVHRAADTALEMLEACKGMTIGGKVINLRVGLNSGEVTAGVIGSVKFLYDLWGDAVNTASRMESASTPNNILVTEQMYNTLLDHYHLDLRGVVDIKGKGEMNTYYLRKKRTLN